MANKGRSERDLFGGYTNYDAKGNKVGRSDPGLFGGYTHYDAKGNKTGHSDPGLFGGYTNYDAKGNKVGRSDPGLFGGYTNYDAKGNKISQSDPNFSGGYSHSDGCYVATAVYGSYDCPEVWTLRRFRDRALKPTRGGRLFVKLYYAVSPTLVRLFGGKAFFQKPVHAVLNRFVARLRAKGYADTPYRDGEGL